MPCPHFVLLLCSTHQPTGFWNSSRFPVSVATSTLVSFYGKRITSARFMSSIHITPKRETTGNRLMSVLKLCGCALQALIYPALSNKYQRHYFCVLLVILLCSVRVTSIAFLPSLGERSSSVLPEFFLFFSLFRVFFFLLLFLDFPHPARGSKGIGCYICRDCKALWGICSSWFWAIQLDKLESMTPMFASSLCVTVCPCEHSKS